MWPVRLGLLWVTEPAQSYAPATHREIGAAAVDRSGSGHDSENRYRVDGGATFFINGETVQTWIANGAAREDFPGIRSLNHFHNPLKAWARCGWTPRTVVRLLATEPGSGLRWHMVMAGGSAAPVRVSDVAGAGGARAGACPHRSGPRPSDAYGSGRGVAGAHAGRSAPDPRRV